jgi:hypothetical protein
MTAKGAKHMARDKRRAARYQNQGRYWRNKVKRIERSNGYRAAKLWKLAYDQGITRFQMPRTTRGNTAEYIEDALRELPRNRREQENVAAEVEGLAKRVDKEPTLMDRLIALDGKLLKLIQREKRLCMLLSI